MISLDRKPVAEPGGRLRRVAAAVALSALLAAGCSNGGDDTGGGTATERPSATSEGSAASGSSEPVGDSDLPDACSLVDLQAWGEVVAQELGAPDGGPNPVGSGSTCGLPAAGTVLPFLVSLTVEAADGPAGALLELSDAPGVEGAVEVPGLGDDAVYTDQNTTADGDPIADAPGLAVRVDGVVFTVLSNDESIGRVQLEALAKLVVAKLGSS